LEGVKVRFVMNQNVEGYMKRKKGWPVVEGSEGRMGNANPPRMGNGVTKDERQTLRAMVRNGSLPTLHSKERGTYRLNGVMVEERRTHRES
jgi:hypothetical protein